MNNKPGMMANELSETELDDIFGGASAVLCKCGTSVTVTDIKAGVGMFSFAGAGTTKVLCKSCVSNAKAQGADLSGFKTML